MAPNSGKDSSGTHAAASNSKFNQRLQDVLTEAGISGPCPKTRQGNLLYALASKAPENALQHRKHVVKCILDDSISANPQLDAACEYLASVGEDALDTAAFNRACGIGVQVSDSEITTAVAAVVAANKAVLQQERYHFNTKLFLPELKAQGNLKWADMKQVMSELDKQVVALLGPKTAADEQEKTKDKKKKPKADKVANGNVAAAKPNADAAEEAWRTADPYAQFPKPHENKMVHTTVYFSDGTKMPISNSSECLQQHLKRTGGKIMTRFPPEPNGYLHIGHAKAMFIDFGMAAQYDGDCYLRYDDTNPEAEKDEYIQHIQEIVAWLGWKPFKITYSSDYFQQLYDLAVKMIKSGHAYVDHQTADDIKLFREQRKPSPWRDRPAEESLKLFNDMRRGLVDEGAATLRMRMDHKNENFNMFDLIAYRIKFCEHPHAGDKWCIYPSYDYTHCIVDSLEDITHSLCTLEFESRRASYYWLLEVLDLYKPFVWEYSRLNITNNVMSKRKLNKLVFGGFVNGWDDPRLLTLAGLRRRGVNPSAINLFCREIGITRSENEISLQKLEHHIRADLDASAPRTLAVLAPLKVVIQNLPSNHYEEVEAQRFPGRTSETYKVPFTQVVYIEQTDFREQDSKDYYGLAPGKSVMLRYAYPITCTNVVRDAAGNVCELHAELASVPAGKKPPKGVLNWVGQRSPGKEPIVMEARLYAPLFKSSSPGELEDWLADLNPESLSVSKGYVNPTLADAKPGDKFQFERLGYFCMDPDSKPGQLVFNRTVTLKESFPKQNTA